MASVIRLTAAAMANVEETGTDVDLDRRRIRDGQYTREQLLAACLDGADQDRVRGWHEYVNTIVEAADRNQAIDESEVQS